MQKINLVSKQKPKVKWVYFLSLLVGSKLLPSTEMQPAQQEDSSETSKNRHITKDDRRESSRNTNSTVYENIRHSFLRLKIKTDSVNSPKSFTTSVQHNNMQNQSVNTPYSTYPTNALFKSSKKINSSDEVVVAVIDTGIDLSHPALQSQLWINQGEDGIDENGISKRTNGIDDDGNGFIDDVHGWNFVDQNNNVQDKNGHGTHISGLVAANGREGIKGIAPSAKIMTIKYYEEGISGLEALNNSVKAINYAIQMGAKIVNYSGGGPVFSKSEQRSIHSAGMKNILFVAAAGNEAQSNDEQGFYPASYPLDNIISVGASSSKDEILQLSNYGVTSVDILAPGKDILSTQLGGGFSNMTGTSQATAIVSGMLARILLNISKDVNTKTLKQKLLQLAVRDGKLRRKVKHQAKLRSLDILNLRHQARRLSQ